MESEEDAQSRIDRWNEEQERRRKANLMEVYMQRVRLYEQSWAAGKVPVDMAPPSR